MDFCKLEKSDTIQRSCRFGKRQLNRRWNNAKQEEEAEDEEEEKEEE